MPVNTLGKHASFISRSISLAVQLKAAYDQFAALREEWDSLAYSTGITDSDFTNANAYLNAAGIQAFYVSQGNLVTYWQAGNGTNICAMIP
jgi:hypothetical protein